MLTEDMQHRHLIRLKQLALRGDAAILFDHWSVDLLAVKGSAWATFRRWAWYSARALSADFQVARVSAASPSSRVESPSGVATLGLAGAGVQYGRRLN
jgi:hypothetical protein